MYNHLLQYSNGMNAPQDVFTWLERRNSKGELANQGEVEHIIDFFCSGAAPKNFVRMSYEAANKKANEWVEKMNKQAKEVKEKPEDTEVAHDFGDGFRFVKLIGKNAYDREGMLMGHCVSSYFGKDDEIYSLRDAKNEPHCTISRSSQQIKGKGNGSIHPKYIRYVVEFLESLKIDVRDSEMKNLGYYNIEPVIEDIDTTKLNLFRDKYLFIDDLKNIKDKNGDNFCDFRMWSIVPLVSLSVKKELKFNFEISNFVQSAIKRLMARSLISKLKAVANESYSTAVANESYSTAVANEPYSTAVAKGPYSTAVANEHSSIAVANEHSSIAVANESYSTAVAKGPSSTAVAKGPSSTAVAKGHSSTAVANESYSTAVANESYSTAVANEYSSTAVANEPSSTAVANEHYSTAVANGSYSTAEVKSKNTIGLTAKWGSKAKGVIGAWLVLTEWDEKKENIIAMEAFRIDGRKYKENTFYTLKDKKIVESK